MAQTTMGDWIGPQEASLILSTRKGVYVSPDDIKQLRSDGKFPEGSYIRISERNTVYKRGLIEQFEGLTKRVAKDIDAYRVAVWLWEFPLTVEYLEKQGYKIPQKDQAQKLVPQIQANQANPKKNT